MVAGILLFVLSLTTLGALVGLAATLQVFVLNMAYDVPVKLFSFHLILMTLVLLAPDASWPRVCHRIARWARRRSLRSCTVDAHSACS